MNHNRSLWLKLGGLIVTLGLVVFVMASESSNRLGVKILVHDHGTTNEISGNLSAARELRAACEEALTSADPGNMLRLAIFPETIESIKRESLSVEINYPELRRFKVEKADRVLEVDRLLVELSKSPNTPIEDRSVGVFYGKFSGMFFQSYSSGPYLNSGQFDERIRNLLRKMGFRTD